MTTRQQLPPGLFRRRRRDGNELPELWCYYYVRGRAQPVKERTGTCDIEEARRFLYARKAEHPTARTQRVARQTITTADALVLYERDAQDHRRPVQRGQMLALKHAIGSVPLVELNRACLDELCRTWRTVGVE
jgi:hypothetical protein